MCDDVPLHSRLDEGRRLDFGRTARAQEQLPSLLVVSELTEVLVRAKGFAKLDTGTTSIPDTGNNGPSCRTDSGPHAATPARPTCTE